MKALIGILVTLFSLNVFATDLPVEKFVDVSRYVGKWYAHYSLPQFFTRKCNAQTAEYEVINKTTISVFNTCLKSKGETTISGKAVVINPESNSKLEVTFDNFFTRLFRVKGDYNIIKLDSNYDYVLVGSNDRKSLWLMSRSEVQIPTEIKDFYLKYAADLGFDISKIVESRFHY